MEEEAERKVEEEEEGVVMKVEEEEEAEGEAVKVEEEQQTVQ